MEPFVDILATLVRLGSIASTTEDHWGFTQLNGNEPSVIHEYGILKRKLADLGFNNLIQFEINKSVVDDDDLLAYSDHPEKIKSWQIVFNKLPLTNKRCSDGWHYNLFISVRSCTDWLNGINPILKDCPFNTFENLRIIVEGLSASFGGYSTQYIAPGQDNKNIKPIKKYTLPAPDRLRESIHFITAEDISINCDAYNIDPSSNSVIEKAFVYQCCVALTTCLVTEYYSFDKVVIDGIKRVLMRIDDGKSEITYSFYKNLLELISWLHEDRITVRKKLFSERLTLDLDTNDTLLTSLIKCINGAFLQAKERYNFVIIDRKDAYVKELKELLKDIRTQSELYSGKIRSLLSNFLRDLLAAIVLVGFTIFTKFSDNTILANHSLLRYVFWGLAIYYILSIIMQAVIDITDISVSKKEILYWKNATKELLPEKEFKDHIDNSLEGRRLSLRIIYPIIALCYVAIAFVCYKFPVIFEEIIKRK